MRNFINVVLIITAVASSAAAQGQASAIAEEQLNKGFLGDQNARLTDPGVPANDSYAARASAALERKDYTRALGILRPYRRTHDVAYHYLAGQAYEGLGDYGAARRELTEAARRGRTAVAPQLALGLIEAQHGDKAIATAILASLTERRTKCADKCSAAPELSTAVISLEAALRARHD